MPELQDEAQAEPDELGSARAALRASQDALEASQNALEVSQDALEASQDALEVSQDALRGAEIEQQRLAAGLHMAEEELRMASERREQLLAMLSHELRNPLAAVLSAATILRLEAEHEQPTHDGTRARNVVERQTRHIILLLDDVLDVARFQRGTIELHERPCDLHDAIEAGIEGVASLIAGRSIDLQRALPKEPLPMRGDPTRLQQVVTNLLSNAVRHSNPGGTIELSVERDHDEAILSLRDHGTGIDPELLPRIFEPFVQAEQGLDRAHGGLGMGLTLVRSIVELHGGSVCAKSEGPGKGSELVVRLPLTNPRSAEVPKDSEPHEQCRVVLVEDHPDAREMMRLLLTTRGYHVVEAEDGGAGVDAIERVRPHVALVDIGLPTMSGYDVARRIRGNRALDSVRLVAITGYGTRADVETARKAGFDEHLTKPADTRRLESILARCCPSPASPA